MPDTEDLYPVTAAHTVPIGLPRNLTVLMDAEYSGRGIVGTLDLSTDDGLEAYQRSGAAVDLDRETAAIDWWAVDAWVAEAAENVSTDPEKIQPGVRVTLFSGRHAVFTFSGAVPHQSLSKIRQIFGDGPWLPPLWMTLQPFTTSKGRASYILIARRTPPVEDKRS